MKEDTTMQKLYFEPAWDKTIAPKDREKIEVIFQEQAMSLTNGIHFSFLWKAMNHKGELLIAVLIHNCKNVPLLIQNTSVTYSEHDEQSATGLFNVPCEIAENTSMPWTFIFSTSNQTRQAAQYIIQN